TRPALPTSGGEADFPAVAVQSAPPLVPAFPDRLPPAGINAGNFARLLLPSAPFSALIHEKRHGTISTYFYFMECRTHCNPTPCPADFHAAPPGTSPDSADRAGIARHRPAVSRPP